MYRKYILFDLDGTLTDPMQGITKSVRYALNSFCLILFNSFIPTKHEKNSVIGKAHQISVILICPFLTSRENI